MKTIIGKWEMFGIEMTGDVAEFLDETDVGGLKDLL